METLRMKSVWVYCALMLITLTIGRSEVAYVMGETTFIPLWMLNESMDGGFGDYDEAKQTVTLSVFNDGGTFVFKLGADTATRDGNPLKLEAAPFRIGSMTYVPLDPALCQACAITTAAPKNGFLPLTYGIPEGVTEFEQVNHTINMALQPLTPEELALCQKPIADADALAIFNAVVHSDAKAVVQLLKAHPELRYARDNFGDLPLHFAIRCRQRNMVETLLANGASLEDRNAMGSTALHVAVFPDVHGYDPNPHYIGEVDQLGVYPEGSSVEGMVDLVIKLGGNINAPNKDGLRPLHLTRAITGRYPDIVTALLAAGADVNAEDCIGRTPLFVISDPAVGELLLAKGADIKHADSYGGTALHSAAGDIDGGNPLYIKFLLEHGLPVNGKDNGGVTPLMTAIGAGYIEIVTLLLDNGADVNASDGQVSVLMRAVSRGDNENSVPIVKLLLARGASVNAEKDGMLAPLHSACYGGNAEIVKLLLAAGAKVNATDQRGQTPLQTAKRLDNQEIVKLLEAARAK